MADATYLVSRERQLLGVQGLATEAGASSLVSVRTPQPKGHPHPGLFWSTKRRLSLRALSP
jgi:hypothetical protein